METALPSLRWDSSPYNCSPGLILHGGNEGDCLRVPWSLPWCPWIAPVQICNFIIGCSLPRSKCLGALALSKTKHTALVLFTFAKDYFFSNKNWHHVILIEDNGSIKLLEVEWNRYGHDRHHGVNATVYYKQPYGCLFWVNDLLGKYKKLKELRANGPVKGRVIVGLYRADLQEKLYRNIQ